MFHPEVFARGGITGLFKILGGVPCSVGVKCKFQGGAHRIQEGANVPPPAPPQRNLDYESYAISIECDFILHPSDLVLVEIAVNNYVLLTTVH